jgi:protein-S-isoprenylcysteine O-methyltransferase Ste14
MRTQHKGLVAAVFNAVVLAPALAWSSIPAWSLHGWTFATLVTAFAYLEASSCPGLDLPSGRTRLETMTGIALWLVFIVALSTAGPIFNPSSLVLGAFIMAGGVSLRWAAMHTLGSAFVTEVRAARRRDLVTHGIYAWMRHPSETGLLCIAGGACLVLGSLSGGVACLALLLPLVLVRVHIEDGELLRGFGADYAAYRRRVRALC